jgi:hypothetical protein
MGGVVAQRDEDAVLQKIMENGTFDELRRKVLNELKQNVSMLFGGWWCVCSSES